MVGVLQYHEVLCYNGSDSSNSSAVIATDHTNSGIRSGFLLFGFTMIVVEMKFTAPRTDDKR
jgi:hypothetical protein